MKLRRTLLWVNGNDTKKLREAICNKFKFDSLEYQTVEGALEAIGMSADDVCTYCWNGKE